MSVALSRRLAVFLLLAAGICSRLRRNKQLEVFLTRLMCTFGWYKGRCTLSLLQFAESDKGCDDRGEETHGALCAAAGCQADGKAHIHSTRQVRLSPLPSMSSFRFSVATVMRLVSTTKRVDSVLFSFYVLLSSSFRLLSCSRTSPTSDLLAAAAKRC